MTAELAPDIPRLYTAVAEWLACVVMICAAGPRKNLVRVVVIGSAALPAFVVLQHIAGMLPLSLWMVGMFSAAALMVVLIWLCADVEWSGALYVGVRAFVLAELVASLEWQLQYFFLGDPSQSSTAVEALWLTVTYIIVFPVVYWMLRNAFQSVGPLKIDSGALTGAIAIALATFFVSNLSFAPIATPFSGTLALEVLNIRTLIDATGFAALYAQESMRLRAAEAVELEGAQVLLRSQHNQYLQSRANIDEVNRKYHDLKHYIAAIRAESEPERRSEYLDRLEQSVKGYENQVHSGNAAMDAILTAKQSACNQSRITITSVVDGRAVGFIDPLDLSVVLGNALDNAIESVSSIPDDERKLIKVAVFRQGEFAVVRVENYFDSDVTFTGGLPVTTKRDARNHGYGLRNLREVVEGYGGTVTVNAADGWFAVRVLFPVPVNWEEDPDGRSDW